MSARKAYEAWAVVKPDGRILEIKTPAGVNILCVYPTLEDALEDGCCSKEDEIQRFRVRFHPRGGVTP